jgi:predicted SAM-dependent methyltransferase
MRKILLHLFSHRFLALSRWDLHFLLLRAKNAVTYRARLLQRFVASRQDPVFLNFGSGPRGLDNGHWVNLDGYPDVNVHFLLDLARPIPVPDNSFDGIFCEHVFEHFGQDEGERVAREMFRVLRPGGRLRLIVPDAEKILRWYFDCPDRLAGNRDCATAMEAVNSYFRQRYEHQFMYDFMTLRRALERAGFAEVALRSFRSGASNELAMLDDPRYEPESLYVEAVRMIQAESGSDENSERIQVRAA